MRQKRKCLFQAILSVLRLTHPVPFSRQVIRTVLHIPAVLGIVHN